MLVLVPMRLRGGPVSRLAQLNLTSSAGSVFSWVSSLSCLTARWHKPDLRAWVRRVSDSSDLDYFKLHTYFMYAKPPFPVTIATS